MRRTTEFILRVKQVYTLADIRKMDYVTYFQMLSESEEAERQAIARMEKAET